LLLVPQHETALGISSLTLLYELALLWYAKDSVEPGWISVESSGITSAQVLATQYEPWMVESSPRSSHGHEEELHFSKRENILESTTRWSTGSSTNDTICFSSCRSPWYLAALSRSASALLSGQSNCLRTTCSSTWRWFYQCDACSNINLANGVIHRIGTHQEGEVFVQPGHKHDHVFDAGNGRILDLGGQGPDEVPSGIHTSLHL
jgi:hypothetical protein